MYEAFSYRRIYDQGWVLVNQPFHVQLTTSEEVLLGEGQAMRST